MSERSVGWAFLALAMVGVGSTVVASKVIGAGLPPFTATALRFALAFPIFAALMRLTRTPWPRPDRHDGFLLLLQAGAGSVGYSVLLIAGTRLTGAADAGVVVGALPAVAALFAVLVLGERPGPTLLGAVALAACGAFATVVRLDSGGVGGLALSRGALLGNALVLASVACEALFVLVHKRLRAPIPPLALSTVMSGAGLAVALPPALLEAAAGEGAATASALLGVAYYALVPTVLGFLLWYAGAARTSAVEASLFTALAPVSAVFLAAIVLGEEIRPAQLAGMACVLAAVLLAGLQENRGRRFSRNARRPSTKSA
jgi:drug/metabolite transporter (DMT)-like permease